MTQIIPEFVVVQDEEVYDAVTQRPHDWVQKGMCRVGVRDGRLVVLTPVVARSR